MAKASYSATFFLFFFSLLLLFSYLAKPVAESLKMSMGSSLSPLMGWTEVRAGAKACTK